MYGRGYGLFTLVGIDGEDDLDAPDLDATSKTEAAQPPRSDRRSQSTGDGAVAARARHGAKLRVRSGRPVLTSAQSAILRHCFLGQLLAIHSTHNAAVGAHQMPCSMDTLTLL